MCKVNSETRHLWHIIRPIRSPQSKTIFLKRGDTIFHSYLSNVFDVLQFNDNIFCTRRFDLLKAQVTVDSNNNNDISDRNSLSAIKRRGAQVSFSLCKETKLTKTWLNRGRKSWTNLCNFDESSRDLDPSCLFSFVRNARILKGLHQHNPIS